MADRKSTVAYNNEASPHAGGVERAKDEGRSRGERGTRIEAEHRVGARESNGGSSTRASGGIVAKKKGDSGPRKIIKMSRLSPLAWSLPSPGST